MLQQKFVNFKMQPPSQRKQYMEVKLATFLYRTVRQEFKNK